MLVRSEVRGGERTSSLLISGCVRIVHHEEYDASREFDDDKELNGSHINQSPRAELPAHLLINSRLEDALHPLREEARRTARDEAEGAAEAAAAHSEKGERQGDRKDDNRLCLTHPS